MYARSVEVEVSRRFRHWFSARLLEGFFETARQGIVPVALGLHGLLKERFPASLLLRQNAGSFVEFWRVGPSGDAVRDHAAEIGIHDKGCAAARAFNLDFALELRHVCIVAASQP